MSETKVVHGILLERRTCACGCGCSWFAKPDSPSQHRGRLCREWVPSTPKPENRRSKSAYYQRMHAAIPEGHVPISEICGQLGMSSANVWRLVKTGVLPATPIPGFKRGFYFHPDRCLEAYGKYKDSMHGRWRRKAEVSA